MQRKRGQMIQEVSGEIIEKVKTSIRIETNAFDDEIKDMILSALPATQGLYGFVAFLMSMGRDFATEGPLMLGIGLGVGLVCLFSAIRQGQICANGIVGISQGHDVQVNTMIYAALPEFYAILALVAALMI